MFLVLLAVFSFVFASDPQYKLNLIIGLFLYEFFQESTKTGLLSLRAKGYLLTKARFPSWVLVVASASNAVITLALFSVVLLVFLVASGHPPSLAATGLYVVYQAHFLAIVTGFSLAASVLFMRFRDLNQVWEVVTQAGFFVAPIIYPISVLPERLHIMLYVWPPTPIILFSRSVLVDGRVPSPLAHVLLTLEAAIVLGVGALIYRWRAPRVPEEL
jgi:lipopolysaccharide transport system permease protein